MNNDFLQKFITNGVKLSALFCIVCVVSTTTQAKNFKLSLKLLRSLMQLVA